jgi:DNA-binding beta-propeller fold protein YncE
MWRVLFIATPNYIRKVSPSGIITTVAGVADLGFSGDGGPATSAQLNYPNGIAVDLAGNLFIADSVNDRIRKVTPSGVITTVLNGQVHYPLSVAVDATGALFIATDNQI